MRKVLPAKWLCKALTLLAFVLLLLHPGRHAKHYFYIADDAILAHLVENINAPPDTKCNYAALLSKATPVTPEQVMSWTPESIIRGGESRPQACAAAFSTALIVPYFNRTEQLAVFLAYMHRFLGRQAVHYRIFVAEPQQLGAGGFNRARLLNAGAREAIAMGYTCLVLHDVDLLPLNTANLYVCTAMPRHMSSAVDTFRFNLPYEGLCGGAFAILSKDYVHIDGMSNLFYGWGGEDDDFYRRLVEADLEPCRFSPTTSRYTMLRHHKNQPSQDRYQMMSMGKAKRTKDGLSTLGAKTTVVEKDLYTHVLVLN